MEQRAGRRVSAIVTVAGRRLGGVGPFPVDSPWWADVEPVVAHLGRLLSVPVVVLRLLDVRGGEGARDGHVTYHVEALRPPLEGALGPDLPGFDDLAAPAAGRASWATTDGVRDALSWAENALSNAGHRVLARPEQVKTWNLACLFRITTSAGVFWLKTTPPFATVEAEAIAVFRRADPSLVPLVLAADPPHGRTLLAHIPGVDCWQAPEEVIRTTVSRMVTAQAALAHHLPFAADPPFPPPTTPGTTTRPTPGMTTRTAWDMPARAVPGVAARTDPGLAARTHPGLTARTASGMATQAFHGMATRPPATESRAASAVSGAAWPGDGLPARTPRGLPAQVSRLLDGEAGEDLSAEELSRARRLVERLPALVAELEACGLPDTVVHGDFHPGNWRSDGRHTVVLDFADSHVGHPAIDGLRLREYAPDGSAPFVTDAWVRAWSAAIPGSDPSRALTLAEPLAHLSYALRYQEFLDGIELSERRYHEGDPAHEIRAALTTTEARPLRP
ncbi:aminoglycoside phosphotransferase family protein [Sphaerisporangium sp. TRM90804]|uniref:aminoglycoside phosphotransferase family protein n=1 Tax=Sphaerisporangium sp. TRM90804 TaxID=3031113 RepID=UPI002449E738|nr:aminoglycoside phosphotransferase family protein [Sphaerisporangium sp. TRM90804]MDH2426332.1 aminoglycoside phosphotransferase family protein [Sphaerisporangium sp. TRM90804]